MRHLRSWVSRLKHHLFRWLPQRFYWNLMAFYDPVRAVWSQSRSEGDLFDSGKVQVSAMQKLGLLGPAKSVLHIGCGIGRIEKSIAENVHVALGLDISERMVRIARRTVDANNVFFVVGSGRDLNCIRDASFDLCYSFVAFQHMPRRIVTNYFSEVRRILKPDGAFFFQIPIDELRRGKDPPSSHPYAIRSYTTEEVVRLLQNAGLRMVSRCDTNGDPYSPTGDPEAGQFFLAKL